VAIVVDATRAIIGDFRPWLKGAIHREILRSLGKLNDLAVHLDFEAGDLVARDFDAGGLMEKMIVNIKFGQWRIGCDILHLQLSNGGSSSGMESRCYFRSSQHQSRGLSSGSSSTSQGMESSRYGRRLGGDFQFAACSWHNSQPLC
jgi:hypothetical protein